MALVAAGCGGGESSSITKAEFIEQADAICKQADDEQMKALVKANEESPINELGDAKREEVVLSAGLAPVRKELDELSALEVPEGDEQQVDRIISEAEAALAKAEKDALGFFEEYFEKVDRLSTKYGFEDCSEVL